MMLQAAMAIMMCAILATAAAAITGSGGTGELARVGKVITYPAPEGEPASADYEVKVNGKPVFCYTSFRYDTDSKQTISGRPVSPLSFCYFDQDGPVTVEIRFLDGLKKAGIDTSKVIVRPLARGIEPKVKDGKITFTLDKPGQLSIEPGGSLTHALHVFSNPPEKEIPDPKDPNVLYFGPGYHELGETQLKSGQTVYVAGGAIVSLKVRPKESFGKEAEHDAYGVKVYWAPGMIGATWQKNITLRGRGILCGRKAIEAGQRGYLAKFERVDNLKVEGIIIRDCSVWSLHACNCNNVSVKNVKVVGYYVNNDGICMGGSSDAVVEDCFSHNADDSLEIKVWIPQKNVTFRNCIVWNDIGGSFGLMHECGATLENVLYKDCTVLHSTDDASVCPVVGVKLSGPGCIKNIRFEDIVIEDVSSPRRASLKLINNWDEWHMNLPTKPDSPHELLNPPKREQPSGSITNVTFKNIKVLNCRNEDVVLIAENEKSPISGITFENVTINGRKLVPNDPRIKKNAWVSDVTVRE